MEPNTESESERIHPSPKSNPRSARPGPSLSPSPQQAQLVLLSSCLIPSPLLSRPPSIPPILTIFPFYAASRRHQWHHLAPRSYSPGGYSPTLDEESHDHSYVRRDPRGPRRLSRASPPTIRVWGHSCTHAHAHRALIDIFFQLMFLVLLLLRVSTSSPHSSQCEASKNPHPTNFTFVLR